MRLAILLLIINILTTPAFALDRCLSGSWYEPFTEGEGINLEISDELVVGYFYTWKDGFRDMYTLTGYNETDASNAPWFDEFVTLTGHASFLLDGLHQTFQVGHAAIEVLSDDILILAWEWEADWGDSDTPIPQCTRYECSGVRVMLRLTQPIECN